MHNPKMVVLAYSLAVAFILVVAFHTPSRPLIAASAQVEVPLAAPK